MGSYFTLHVGSTEILTGKNYLSPDILVPFQAADVRVMEANVEIDGYEGMASYVLQASAGVIARRLDLLGFTMAVANDAYSTGLSQEEGADDDYEWPADLQAWQADVFARAARHEATSSQGRVIAGHWVWEEHFLGFPNADFLTVLGALVDAADQLEVVKLDLTDMIEGGYLEPDPIELCRVDERVPVVVLTEGKSDARLLHLVLDVLFSEYAAFVRFLDYDFARAAGGTGEVVRFVKMFAGSGIKNRVVALFDNDTAGHQALAELGQLPDNVFAMSLPSLPMFRAFPSTGPDGHGASDVDGRACSLELYLGRDALTGPDGRLRPVRWTGFNEKLGQYQGEISSKGEVQKRFEEILACVRADPSERTKYDFAGIEAIFDAMFRVLAGR